MLSVTMPKFIHNYFTVFTKTSLQVDISEKNYIIYLNYLS